MGEVELVFFIVDHIRKPSSKVRVGKGTILQFEFEACIESNNQG